MVEMKAETLAVALFVCTTLTAQTPANQRLEGLDVHVKELMQTFKTPGHSMRMRSAPSRRLTTHIALPKAKPSPIPVVSSFN